MASPSLEWDLLSRPCTIQSLFSDFAEAGFVPSTILHGPRGCGKYTMVRWFLSKIHGVFLSLRSTTLQLESSRSQDKAFVVDESDAHLAIDVRKVPRNLHTPCLSTICTRLCKATNVKGPPMAVILRGAHTLGTDAQAYLRRVMEEYDSRVRFIFLVEEGKAPLIGALRSRTLALHMQPPSPRALIDALERCGGVQPFGTSYDKPSPMPRMEAAARVNAASGNVHHLVHAAVACSRIEPDKLVHAVCTNKPTRELSQQLLAKGWSVEQLICAVFKGVRSKCKDLSLDQACEISDHACVALETLHMALNQSVVLFLFLDAVTATCCVPRPGRAFPK